MAGGLRLKFMLTDTVDYEGIIVCTSVVQMSTALLQRLKPLKRNLPHSKSVISTTNYIQRFTTGSI